MRALRREDGRLPGTSPVPGINPVIRPGQASRNGLVAERHAALREAFSRVSPGCQRLLTLLIDDPAMPDAEISARLGIAAGSIGPACRRCLDKLRRDPVIAALTGAGTAPWQTPGRAGG
jgi:DNA-directed RNA polymerase specialized sigma24 family protein